MRLSPGVSRPLHFLVYQFQEFLATQEEDRVVLLLLSGFFFLGMEAESPVSVYSDAMALLWPEVCNV